METAQARQAVAQAELRRVQAQGAERDAYQGLLAAVGVNVELKVDAVSAARRPLPAPASAPLEATIRQALSRRPDVAASYAAVQASKAGVKAAQADYLPKVYAGGNLAWGSGDFDVSGLPSIGQQGSGNGLLVGVTLPLYDAGLREAQVREAESRAKAAADELQRVQTAAVTEIIAARNALRTALESHRAATALVAAASTTYDAALAAYRNGLGTIDAATEADTALLDARQAQADAHAAALAGAVNLAFVVGALTSRESLP
jgi:outer membrane protein TolC